MCLSNAVMKKHLEIKTFYFKKNIQHEYLLNIATATKCKDASVNLKSSNLYSALISITALQFSIKHIVCTQYNSCKGLCLQQCKHYFLLSTQMSCCCYP